MSLFAPVNPEPLTRLGYYRYLAPRASILVSPLCLGGLSIGDKWAAHGMGAMDKESSFRLLDAYFAAGGNFIDTANYYQDGSSEEFIGEWAESRGIRDQLVIATKYSQHWDDGSVERKVRANYMGNSVKSLALSVEASLKKLRTTYIDIFYCHNWDNHTSVEEIMDALHNLVVSGKVLYLGVSNMPAWLVLKANEYARYNGKTPFVIYQVKWSVLERDTERDILPMCRHEGIALAPYGVLAAGHIRTDEEEERRLHSGELGRQILPGQKWKRTHEERAVCQVLERIAKEVGAKSITAVAIAYVMQKAPFIFPIIGGRKVEQLEANVEALNIHLTEEHFKLIDDASPFQQGYPVNVIGEYGQVPRRHFMFAKVDTQPLLAAIKPPRKN
ncbi:aryl-alcohol dehydrogenase [NADP+] [Dichomitus squalens LYAD-421 SS1]|uniref:Aryl-alcohol dehydrogenase [NADP+] n=1 Tax=Dichomitus squalens (strain LYAD-421) TaxID=732165 RepID=R7T2W3_DICSQ|nr:aryl-alcohol dehydrogenase [NADP+] [Dichomitus squalens LYAD-421 SS1]EJF62157.1 aryl-alcohol dehydrogenase [NADP+] [Dichomitus squalens LYAD-421 SS1]